MVGGGLPKHPNSGDRSDRLLRHLIMITLSIYGAAFLAFVGINLWRIFH